MTVFSRFSMAIWAFLLCLSVVGCGKDRPRLNPLDPSTSNPAPAAKPTPTPTPYVQSVWKNGVTGTWFSGAVTLTNGYTAGHSTVITATDPITGDTQALQQSSDGSFLSGMMQLNGTYGWIGGYGPAGHLQFDIRLDRAASGFNYLSVRNRYSGGVGIDVFSLPGIAVGSFVHASIPISSMGPYDTSSFTPIYFDWQTSCYCSGALFTINDVRWTPN